MKLSKNTSRTVHCPPSRRSLQIQFLNERIGHLSLVQAALVEGFIIAMPVHKN